MMQKVVSRWAAPLPLWSESKRCVCVWCGARADGTGFWNVEIGSLCDDCFTLYINSTPEEQARISRYRELESMLELE